MKRHLLIFALLIGTLFGYSQTVTVHVDGESLENLLSQEQVQSLQTLNITGTLTNNDYAFLRGNKFPKLRKLNLKDADIDTIPAKAFYATEYYYDSKIILPKTCVYVGDSAFYKSSVTIELTGKFPIVGTAAISYSYNTKRNLEVCDKNPYCKDSVGYILSFDGTILWFCRCTDNSIYKEIPAGVEIIAERAFEYAAFNKVIIPETIKEIKDYAFYNCSPNGIMGSEPETFVIKSKYPPILGKDVFNGPFFAHKPILVIPESSIESYKEADDQWHIFGNIQEELPISNTSFTKKEKRNLIAISNSTLHCTAPDALKLEVYTMDAVKVGEARFVGGEATVKVGSTPALYLYIVTYSDGRRESGKVVVNEE